MSCQCGEAVQAIWGCKWTLRVARGWESLWCANIHGGRADLAQGMPGHMSPLGSFSMQGRAEHPGSCEQRGCHLRGARGQHCSQPHCLLGGARVHQRCPALVRGDGRHRGALLPGIPKGSPTVWAARSCIPHPSPPLPTASGGCRDPCWVFGKCWQRVSKPGAVQLLSSQLLPSGMLFPGDLLLRPHARGLSHGRRLGRLATGGRALGDQDLPE